MSPNLASSIIRWGRLLIVSVEERHFKRCGFWDREAQQGGLRRGNIVDSHGVWRSVCVVEETAEGCELSLMNK